jgi:acyl carrier protein
VLALEQPVGLTENFFTLGGHSLLATQVISRIRAIFHVDISLHDFFKTPTIAALALFIEESSGTKKEEEYIETTHVDINQLTTEEIDTLLSHLLQSYGDLEP